MRTNIDLDEDLLKEFKLLSKSKTKREAVNLALFEAVKMRKRNDLLNTLGRVDWEGDLSEWRKSKHIK